MNQTALMTSTGRMLSSQVRAATKVNHRQFSRNKTMAASIMPQAVDAEEEETKAVTNS